MKTVRALFLISMLSLCIRSAATTLPDACGDNKVQFNVKTVKNQPPPAPPDAGKAQIVIVSQVDASALGGCIGCNTFTTTRVGMDGFWVGAAKENYYFALSIAPGEHHVCAYSTSATRGKNVGVTSFTAEAGKIYYFQVTIKNVQEAISDKYSTSDWILDLTQLSKDEGRYRVKISALAQWKQK